MRSMMYPFQDRWREVWRGAVRQQNTVVTVWLAENSAIIQDVISFAVAGGRYVSRTCAEDRVGAGGVAVYGRDFSGGRRRRRSRTFRYGRHNDDGYLLRARDFSAHRGPKSFGTSQSDRLRSLVELRACGRHVRTRHEDAERAPRISRRLRRACRDWDNADFVGSKKSWRQTRVHGVVLRLIRSPSPTMISEAISSPTFSTHQIGARKYRCKRGFTNKLRGQRFSRLPLPASPVGNGQELA